MILRHIPLQARNELAGNTRLGGKRDGPYAGDCSLWSGRPPRLESGFGPDGFVVSASTAIPEGNPPDQVAQAVLLELECGNAWGGRTRRLFNVAAGLSVDMRLGNFENVVLKILNTQRYQDLEAVGIFGRGIPAGMEVFFSWTWEFNGRGDLRLFQAVPVGTILRAPEGAEAVMTEAACVITWLVPSSGTTFTQAVPAATLVPVAFASAFTCNVATPFVWQLRGL